MRQNSKLSMLAAVVLLALTLGGCIRLDSVHGGNPSSFTHIEAGRVATSVMQDTYFMLLVDEYLACESDSARASFASKRFAELEIELHGDRVELWEHSYPHLEPIHRTVYIDSERLATSSKGYSLNGTTIIARGGELYDVAKNTSTITADMVLRYRRGAFGERDLLMAESATISQNKDGLAIDMQVEELMMAVRLNKSFYGQVFRGEFFNGRIDVDIKSSAMDSPDHYSYSYNYSGNYDKL